MRILLVSGSTRGASTNTAALRTAGEVVPDGVSAVLYGGLPDLPAFTPDADDERPHPAVADLRAQLAAADAVVFCTPEYAGSLPGSVKNLLDWTVGTGDLYGKPVAWINVAAEGRGGGALANLAEVLRYVGASIVEPACVRLPVPRGAVGPDGTLRDADLRAGIAAALESLAAAVDAAPVSD